MHFFIFRELDNLAPRQLLANAEIKLPNNDRMGTEYEILRTTQAEELRFPSICPETKKWMEERSAANLKPRWINKADFDVEKPVTFPEPNYCKYNHMTITEVFEQFIDNSFIDLLVEETKRYALFKNCTDPKITAEEIRCFIAILFVSGYNDLPSKRHYWDFNEDMKNVAVSQSMRRDRFLQICRFIHCVDNTKIDKNDKAWKIRPLMEKLKEKCIENFIPENDLSYDESMIKYYGKHSCKQFIRGKPIRFGYKMWCLNTKDGYLANFELYQGKSPKANPSYEKYFGKAASPLLVLLDEMPPEKRNLRYNFYMDNLFSGSALFSYLKFRGYSAIGTIRENRIPKLCPLTAKKDFTKKQRGYFESAVEANDGNLYVRWLDNSVVTMISSTCGTQEVTQTKRFSQQLKRTIMVSRPKVVTKYNSFMGGTDQMDQNVNCYRIGVRAKKWYWPIFTWLLDTAMQNSWVLYNKTGRKISQLEFKREITNTYLKKYGVPPKATGRPPASRASSDCRISDTIRYDGSNHLVKHTDGKKKKRCGRNECKSIIRTMCAKCGVGLCIDCFIPFHSR